MPKVITRPCILERLREHFGSYGKMCRALEVPDSYPPRWRHAGYIPELFALDIDGLHVRDRHGEITAYTVLEEARDGRWRLAASRVHGEGVS